jgi:hypothetical protein
VAVGERAALAKEHRRQVAVDEQPLPRAQALQRLRGEHVRWAAALRLASGQLALAGELDDFLAGVVVGDRAEQDLDLGERGMALAASGP